VRETSFFWHDYETWGANPRADWPAQFAGMRTDIDLNPLDQPVSFYCKPPIDRLPQPMAVAVTGITPQQAQQRGLAEAEFFTRVEHELALPGTCGVGYNSLRFDDEVTRFGFYRNFRDPYAREWQNANGRWDIIDMLRLTRALRPEGINWPVREDGAPSFRLEQLAAENGIEHHAAHDALSDVYATIDLARLVRTRQPRLYAYVLDNKGKAEASALLNLRDKTPLLHVSGMFPAERGSMAVVMPLQVQSDNKNAVVVCDLRPDPRCWLDLPAEEIRRLLFTTTDELVEDEQRPALKTVHLNRCPVLVPLSTLSASAQREWSVDLDQCERHRQMLLAAGGLDAKLRTLFGGTDFAASDDPDEALYDGFISDADRRRCNLVLGMSADSLATTRIPFNDRRLPELLFRYRARNWPQSLSEAEQARWRGHCVERLKRGDLLPTGFVDEYEQALAQRPDRAAPLNALHDWVREQGLLDV
jgi:exodeoxyribonuclease-1